MHISHLSSPISHPTRRSSITQWTHSMSNKHTQICSKEHGTSGPSKGCRQLHQQLATTSVINILLLFTTFFLPSASAACGDVSCPANTMSKPASTVGSDVASCCGCETGKQLKNNIVSFSSDDDCSACPHGYHTGGDKNACSACAAGQYKDTTGGTSVAACKGTACCNGCSFNVFCFCFSNFSFFFCFLSFSLVLFFLFFFSIICFHFLPLSSLSHWKLGKCGGVRRLQRQSSDWTADMFKLPGRQVVGNRGSR